MTERPEPYNPLARVNLGRSVENALLLQEPLALADLKPFVGAGIYAIYYAGDFAAYSPVSSRHCHFPIYVGKAVPAGARQGKLGLNVNPGRALFSRLREHERSISDAKNLDVSDFWTRYLVVEDIWIPLGESLLIAHFRPVWNQAVDGFGIHTPGKGRFGSRRSDWDELHPGRPWYDKMAAHTNPSELEAKIAYHFEEIPLRRPEELTPPAQKEASEDSTSG